MKVRREISMSSEQGQKDCEFIYHEWHERARARDVDALLSLYAEDAILESPLVPAILNTATGVLNGRSEIRRFLEEGTKRRPNHLVRWYRTGSYLCGEYIGLGIPARNPRRKSTRHSGIHGN